MNRQPVIVDCGSCSTPPPAPVDIEVLNCDGTTTTETLDAAPQKVEFIQTKPLIVCSSSAQIDIENHTICNETTNTWHYITVVYTDGVETSRTSIDSGILCSDPLPITPDIEKIDRCDALTGTIHTDVIRYMTDPVTNVTTSSVLSSVDTGIACNQSETDKVVTNWLPICVDGVQWFVADVFLFNNTDKTEIVSKIYKEGADGVIVTAAPTGIINNGACPCVAIPLGVLVDW